jgi:dTDP-4-amino-4,6-dideoxygalactose transaminase
MEREYMIQYGGKDAQWLTENLPVINAKMSELSAIFGLASLSNVKNEIRRRSKLSKLYTQMLAGEKARIIDSPNYSYYPILLNSEDSVKSVLTYLNGENIFPRRYFHPSLDLVGSSLKLSNSTCPVSQKIASRIVCLPIGDDVNRKTMKLICETINAKG